MIIFYILCIALVGAYKNDGCTLENVSKSDITFELFSSGKELGVLNATSVKQAIFDRKLTTKMFVHGWRADKHVSFFYAELRKFYENKSAHNIVFVNWSKIANNSYSVAAACMSRLDSFFADFILAAEFVPEKIHIIGFSMGAHLSGLAGKRYDDHTARKFYRITAVDPAGPRFLNAEPAKRLYRGDALMVDAIHTDGGGNGYRNPLGRVDFYVNGGQNQPGCTFGEEGINFLAICSHRRSIYLYLESLTKYVKAYFAKSWKDLHEGNYNSSHWAIFGENLDLNSRGMFYMKTNSVPPYLID